MTRWSVDEGSLKKRVRDHRVLLRGRPCWDDGLVTSTAPQEASPATGLRALVVEDDGPMADLVASYLDRDGYEVQVTHDGIRAVEVARELDPDVVVLDLGLPGQDGLEVCRQLRTFSDAYVVMLTARSDEVDTLVGLSVGADDYMTKPFSPRELVARLRAMLRRPRPLGTRGHPQPQLRSFGALSIDPLGRDVWLDGEPVPLTRTEFDLLGALSSRPQLAFTRRQLIDEVWGSGWVGDEHLVDVHVLHLRRKLGDDAATSRYIRTVRGVGYRMGTGA